MSLVLIARMVALVADEALRADTAVDYSMPRQLPSDLNVSGRREGHNCCALTPAGPGEPVELPAGSVKR